jgi:hypothetical protein
MTLPNKTELAVVPARTGAQLVSFDRTVEGGNLASAFGEMVSSIQQAAAAMDDISFEASNHCDAQRSVTTLKLRAYKHRK